VRQVARLSAFIGAPGGEVIGVYLPFRQLDNTLKKKHVLPNRQRPMKRYKIKDECQLLVQTSGLQYQGYQKAFS
jgi:hypothetical protein